jgi:uncharacterized membrane protein
MTPNGGPPPQQRPATVLRFASLVLTGVFAGFLVGVLVLELSLRRFDGPVYAQVREVELLHLDDLAAATLLPALLATAALVALTMKARRQGFWLTAAALALLASVLVTTLLFNLPINSDQADWNVSAPPADWASVRDDWQAAHAVRTVAAVLAFGLLAAAAAPFVRRDHVPAAVPVPRREDANARP